MSSVAKSLKETKAIDLTPEERTALAEWRNLCFTLERAQGEHLMHHCKDKYVFAKTYMGFGGNLDQLVADIRQAAAQGNFKFFRERGIAISAMTPSLAEAMLKDLRSAIASKKASLAAHFQHRFGEDIETFLGTPHHGSRLMMAEKMDDADATIQLALWASQSPQGGEIERLRAEIERLKLQMAELSDKFDRLIAEPGRRAAGRSHP
jgi:hypothetical protein